MKFEATPNLATVEIFVILAFVLMVSSRQVPILGYDYAPDQTEEKIELPKDVIVAKVVILSDGSVGIDSTQSSPELHKGKKPEALYFGDPDVASWEYYQKVIPYAKRLAVPLYVLKKTSTDSENTTTTLKDKR